MQEEMMNKINFTMHYGAAKRRYVCGTCMASRVTALKGITSLSMQERATFYYYSDGVVMVRITIKDGDCDDCVLMECVAPQGADQSAIEQGGVSGH
jgi:hypothetical protein